MEKKIKILYIIPSLSIGGAERFLLDLIKNLDKDKFSIHLILFQKEGAWIEEIKQLPVEYLVLNKKHKIDLNNAWQIYKAIKKIKPAIVHTQLGGDLRGRVAAILARVKVIIATEQNINKEENILYSFLKAITALFVQEIVSISKAVQKESKKKYFICSHKYKRVIYNGVDTTKYSYLQNRRNNANKIIVATAARLSHQKGLDILIKAWAKVKPQNAELIIGGEGKEKENLKKLIEKEDLEDKIKLIGWPQSMPDFYKNIDLFVMPSRWEGLGIAALEAAASGTPLLLSDADGLREIAGDSEAWIAKAGSLSSLSESLKKALNEINDLETEKKRKNLRRKIENNFSSKVISKKYQDLYENSSS